MAGAARVHVVHGQQAFAHALRQVVVVGDVGRAVAFDADEARDAVVEGARQHAGDCRAQRVANKVYFCKPQGFGGEHGVAHVVGKVVAGAERAVRAAPVAGEFEGDERGVVVNEVRRERGEAGGVVEPAVQGEDDVFAVAPALSGEADVGQVDADFAGCHGHGLLISAWMVSMAARVSSLKVMLMLAMFSAS